MSGYLEPPLGIYVPERGRALNSLMEITESCDGGVEMFSCFRPNFLKYPYLNI